MSVTARIIWPTVALLALLVGSVVWWLGGEGESFDIIRQMIEFL